jgi:hypothetical protein
MPTPSLAAWLFAPPLPFSTAGLISRWPGSSGWGQVHAEVKGLKKAQAKDFDWQYPNDFFAK